MNLKIPTNSKHYYRYVIELLSVFPPFNQMRTREKLLFSEILYYNDLYKDLSEEDRMELIFSQNNKKKMMTTMGVKRANFYSLMTRLRTLGFLDDNKINPRYIFKNGESINIKFEINE